MLARMTLAAWRRSTVFGAFALLALVAELLGRSITVRVDRMLSVVTPLATPTTTYYPFLLAGAKVIGAFAAAALVWRIARAHATAIGAEHVLATFGHRRPGYRPRPRVRFSVRLWLASFTSTALWYLVENDSQRVSLGRWPLLSPWLHTYALAVFAVLALLLAVGWACVSDWLADVEEYTSTTLGRTHRLLPSKTTAPRHPRSATRAPRHLFGLSFESRPPPIHA